MNGEELVRMFEKDEALTKAELDWLVEDGWIGKEALDAILEITEADEMDHRELMDTCSVDLDKWLKENGF
jgi:hypothetical protein